MATNNNSNNTLNNTTDPFDEFEFKPLTAGLGFHKKSELRNTPSTFAPSDKIEFRNPNMTFTKNIKPQIQVPTIEDDSILKAQSAVNEILKNLNHKKQQESLQKTKSRFEWKSTTPSMAAAVLDAMFVTSLFLICMICMLTITKIDLISQFAKPAENPMILISTLALLLTVSFTYMTLLRAYMGYTLGEWAFDQRCGKEIDLASSSYIPKVVLRTLLITATGFLPLTLISFILKFDLAGTLTNLPLQKRA